MADLMNFVMLVCALIAALSFGVFSAYGILRAAFALMRMRQPVRPTVKPKPEMASSIS